MSSFQRQYNTKNKLSYKRVFTSLILLIFIICIYFPHCFFTSNNSESDQNFFIKYQSSSKSYTLQTDSHQIKTNIHAKKPKWTQLPKILWIYIDNQSEKYPIFRKLNLQNTKKFASLSNYTLIQVNSNNFHQYLAPETAKQIFSILQILQKRLLNQNLKYLHNQINQQKQNIFKRLISYFLLYENGGIVIDEFSTVQQNFDTWLQDVLNISNLNMGDKTDLNFKPKCFGFYNMEFSSLRQKVNIKREYEFEKKMVVFPFIEDDLIACEKQTIFMRKLIEAYIDILTNDKDSQRVKRLHPDRNLIGKARKQKIYQHGHILAQHSILQQKQNSINLQNINETYTKLATDSFGLVTLNSNIGLFKLKHFLGNHREIYSFLTKLELKYLIKMTGQLRFVSRIDQKTIEMFQNQIIKNSSLTQFFMQNSFFHFYFLKYWPDDTTFKITKNAPTVSKKQNTKQAKIQIIQIRKPQIYPLPMQKSNQNNKQWQSIEKNIWLIWDKGLKGNSNLIVELCFQNLKNSAQKSGYKLNFVTEENVKEFIDPQTLDKINFALSHADYETTDQAKTDLWRIALVSLHGGLYVDATTFTTEQNFDYIANITRLDSGMIWNRYGLQPENLFFWNGHYGHPADWQFDKKWNTKSQWQLSYQNNFFAAIKNSKLMKEWLQQFLHWMVTDYDQIEKEMKEVGMWYSRWTNKKNRYLLAMDSLKYVIGRKQKEIKDNQISEYQGASHFYCLWSMTGHMNGQQKLREQTSYENADFRLPNFLKESHNIYRHEFSRLQTEQILGPISEQSKFFGFDSKSTNLLLETFSIKKRHIVTFQNLKEIVHPQSILNNIIKANTERSLEIIRFYSKLRQSKMKFKPGNHLGLTV